MDHREPPHPIHDLDEWCRLHMHYWGQQVQRPEATTAAPGSPIHQARLDLDGASGDPLLEVNLAVLAWRSIASAGEHAGLAFWMHQSTEGGVVPRPQMSLARAALLCAARTVYLLHPDDEAERSVRTAELANQEVYDARRYVDVLVGIHGDDDPGVHIASAYFDAVKAAAEETLTAVGAKPGRKILETNMLKAVAPVLADGSEHPEFGVLSTWSRGSAVVHGRSWVWAALPEHAHPAEDFVKIWSIPLGLMGHAWTLWNKRRGTDDPPAYPPPGWSPDPALSYKPVATRREGAGFLANLSRSFARKRYRVGPARTRTGRSRR